LLRRVLPGDVMAKWPFGGMFTVEDREREQVRCDAREIVPAGPMFGKKMHPAARGEAAEREEQVLKDAELTRAAFQGFGKLLSGTRRYCVIYIDDLDAQVESEGVRLSFSLPAGSYATVLLRELTRGSTGEGEEEIAEE
jgi:tRNA pseudouridine13 synthase